MRAGSAAARVEFVWKLRRYRLGDRFEDGLLQDGCGGFGHAGFSPEDWICGLFSIVRFWGIIPCKAGVDGSCWHVGS